MNPKHKKSILTNALQTVNKAKNKICGQNGLCPRSPHLAVCAVSSLRGTSKAGKLAENRRFFDKLKSILTNAL